MMIFTESDENLYKSGENRVYMRVTITMDVSGFELKSRSITL